MTIRFDITGPIREALGREGQDVSAAAKEATLIELYRQGSVSHGQLAEALGISRYEADGVLQRHGVVEDLLTPEQLSEQLAGLRRLLDR